MAQISKRRLDKSTQKRIYQIFVDVVTDAQRQEEVIALLEDFFTPTERVMLPKRLCIAFLLMKNYQHRTIASYLKVSFTTINRVGNTLKTSGKGFRLLLARLETHEQYKHMLESVEQGVVDMLTSMYRPNSVWRKLQAEQQKKKYDNRTSF